MYQCNMLVPCRVLIFRCCVVAGGLSGGHIAGIVIGVLVALIILFIVLYVLLCRRAPAKGKPGLHPPSNDALLSECSHSPQATNLENSHHETLSTVAHLCNCYRSMLALLDVPLSLRLIK